MMETGHQDKLSYLLGANITLAGLSDIVHKLLPYMNALLILIQVTVGLLTIIHFLRKARYGSQTKDRDTRRNRRRRADAKRLRADSQEG